MGREPSSSDGLRDPRRRLTRGERASGSIAQLLTLAHTVYTNLLAKPLTRARRERGTKRAAVTSLVAAPLFSSSLPVLSSRLRRPSLLSFPSPRPLRRMRSSGISVVDPRGHRPPPRVRRSHLVRILRQSNKTSRPMLGATSASPRPSSSVTRKHPPCASSPSGLVQDRRHRAVARAQTRLTLAMAPDHRGRYPGGERTAPPRAPRRDSAPA